MAPARLFIVDAFTDRPFAGNPAAICLPGTPPETTWMQSLAAEMNLSETAILEPDGKAWKLRWFTPTVEVELCGHATLASSHVLWEQGLVAADDPIHFDTLSGRLTASRAGELIELDFPGRSARACEAPPGLAVAIGAEPVFVGRSPSGMLVELDSAEVVRTLRPDMPAVTRCAPEGIIATARSDDDRYDFVSRYFCPGAGIDEDPVTGSAHCCTGPYWAKRLGRDELTGYQASARGGVVKVRIKGDRVILGGRAVTVVEGALCADATA